jgi:hypothetical protein
MGFTKKDNIYKITRMTDNCDSFLGMYFAGNTEHNPEVIEVQIRNPKKKKNQPSKDEISKQVLSGLESINQFLGTSYELSSIYYPPSSDGVSSIYQGLISRLIRPYHIGNKSKEV